MIWGWELMKRLLPSITAVDEYNIHNLSFEVNFDLLLCSVGTSSWKIFFVQSKRRLVGTSKLKVFYFGRESPFFIETRMDDASNTKLFNIWWKILSCECLITTYISRIFIYFLFSTLYDETKLKPIIRVVRCLFF